MTKRVRIRVRLKWHPRWEGILERWSKAYLAKQLWRIDPVFGLDDLLQNAYLVFMRVKSTYPRVVDPPHFMALYKRALINEIIDLSHNNTRRKEVLVSGIDAYEQGERTVGEVSHMGHLSVAVQQAAPEIQAALLLLIQDMTVLRRRDFPSEEVRELLTA